MQNRKKKLSNNGIGINGAFGVGRLYKYINNQAKINEIKNEINTKLM